MTTDEVLGERIDALGDKIDQLTSALEHETQSRQRQIDGYDDPETGVHVPGLRDQATLNAKLISGRTRNFIVALLAVVLAFGVPTYLNWRESQHRCHQIQKTDDAIGRIVGFVNKPNPTRTPERQAAINDFIRTADDLLNNAKAC